MATNEFELQILVRVRRGKGFSMPVETAKDVCENIRENLMGELEAMEIDADEVTAEVVELEAFNRLRHPVV